MGRPNLLFIFSDQHAQRVARCYGDPFEATPNLDRLAERGVVFDRAYCPSPICLPSRMAMLTGRHPCRLRCWNNNDVLASDQPTWAHALGAAGYRPELIGRMHFTGPDQLHGFVERRVGDHNSNWLGGEGLDHGPFRGTAGPDAISIVRSGPGRAAYEIKDEQTAQAAVERLAELGDARAGGNTAPFCLTVGLMLPHPPYVVNTEDYDFFPESTGEPSISAMAETDYHPRLQEWRRKTGAVDLNDADERRARRAYYGLVRKMDRMIGEILTALDTHGLTENTIVIYASDHGDHIGDRGLWWKHTFYDESVKVPLIMSWPNVLPQGERRQQIVNLTDLAATLVEACNAPPLPAIDGCSFLGVAQNEHTPWINETFSEYCTDKSFAFSDDRYARERMLLRDNYKYIYYHDFPAQLFDLQQDPGEHHDLGQDPAYASVRETLRAATLADWDPDAILLALKDGEARKQLWAAWGANTRPKDSFRWQMPRTEELRIDVPIN
ncbi:MAG: sulfatase-like hydrolase/transferase [Pseudomonadota bacterium]